MQLISKHIHILGAGVGRGWDGGGEGEPCVALSRVGVQSCILCHCLSLGQVLAVTRADGPADRKDQEMGRVSAFLAPLPVGRKAHHLGARPCLLVSSMTGERTQGQPGRQGTTTEGQHVQCDCAKQEPPD